MALVVTPIISMYIKAMPQHIPDTEKENRTEFLSEAFFQ